MQSSEVLHAVAKRYFSEEGWQYVKRLPVAQARTQRGVGFRSIVLPEWAQDLGIGEPATLLVPRHCVADSASGDWQSVDWWQAALQLMTCQFEIEHEIRNGPIHSYCSKLTEGPENLWSVAWVNRIFMFLRRWAAWRECEAEEALFGPLPRGTIYLTHDVDYVEKTLALRFKQAALIGVQIGRALLLLQFRLLLSRLKILLSFVFRRSDYWQFERIVEMESKHGMRSSWHFYGGAGGARRTLKQMLFDPAYKVEGSRVSGMLKRLHSNGHQIGLHQAFDSWSNTDMMASEKSCVERALGHSIFCCRQHWLRFCFKDTWLAQEKAGFTQDATLGFNDRPGFRNSAALRMPAWISSERRFSRSLYSVPMMLMDSHLFYYDKLKLTARRKTIDYFLDEIAFVGGEASVIWHQRVFHSDYGWGDEYAYLLDGMQERGLKATL